jgi:hypothetical protein
MSEYEEVSERVSERGDRWGECKEEVTRERERRSANQARELECVSQHQIVCAYFCF